MYFIGDVHGDFNSLLTKIKGNNINHSNLIQVGDFGLGFQSLNDDMSFLKKLNVFLLKSSNHLYVIRGNHDDPAFFDGSIKRSNIHLLPDYSVITLEGKTLLMAGGAISIDRKVRKVGLNYWPQEFFKFDQEKLNLIIGAHEKLDVIVTHTAPSFISPQTYDPLVLRYAKGDETLLQELEAERKLVDQFYSIVKSKTPTHWYYGHFHYSHTELYDNIRFTILNENEFVKYF
jgi:UDP-2,3-diacylglucosamine pyrophosphatase LpxH